MTKTKTKRTMCKVKLYDSLKNEYCKANDIELIRISFFDVDERRVNNLYKDVASILEAKL